MVLMRTSLAQIWPCQPLLYQRCNHSTWGLSLMHLMNWCSTIKCVYFYFQNYLHGSREGLIAYGKHGRLMKLIGDQIQVFPTSSTWTPRHFWSKERKRSNPTRFGAGFGLQDSSNLWCSPRSHTGMNPLGWIPMFRWEKVDNSIWGWRWRSRPDYNHPRMLRLSNRYTTSNGYRDLVEHDQPNH